MRKYGKVKKVASSENAYFRGWRDWNEGDVLQGEYVSSYETTYKGATMVNHRVRVHYCNFTVTDKEGNIVEIENKLLVVNSQTLLNKFMADAGFGAVVEIEYNGKKETKDGNSYHSFELGIIEDAESSIDAAAIKQAQDEVEDDDGL